ncbi:hypothetical protein J6TS7_02060 [Paenibacillus dendritiformis]|nr:hypothetical protein J6TS7_02060 [Paenibacillus dendritiformis]
MRATFLCSTIPFRQMEINSDYVAVFFLALTGWENSDKDCQTLLYLIQWEITQKDWIAPNPLRA